MPFPTPGHVPNLGIKPMALVSPELIGGFFTTVLPGRPQQVGYMCIIGTVLSSNIIVPLGRKTH